MSGKSAKTGTLVPEATPTRKLTKKTINLTAKTGNTANVTTRKASLVKEESILKRREESAAEKAEKNEEIQKGWETLKRIIPSQYVEDMRTEKVSRRSWNIWFPNANH